MQINPGLLYCYVNASDCDSSLPLTVLCHLDIFQSFPSPTSLWLQEIEKPRFFSFSAEFSILAARTVTFSFQFTSA